jgi:preprotein translocase subunit SecD
MVGIAPKALPDSRDDEEHVSNPMPQPAFPPGAPPPRTGPTAATRLAVMALLVMLVLGYLLAVFFTKDIWAGREGTRVVFATHMRDGSPPPPDAMSQALDDVKAGLAERGISGAEIAAVGSNVVATFPGRNFDNDALRNMFGPTETKTLYVRPLIHAMPVEPQTPPSPSAPLLPPAGAGGDRAKLIADEKELRQNTDQTIQVLAMQFQATRCDMDDVLAGHDDPNLPLITCSTDGQTVYLLDKSILGDDDIQRATTDFDSRLRQHVVNLEFDDDAARTWERFTSANIGTQTAFTVDTQVLSAPQIQEAIAGGHTQITGNFTADSARELADALNRGSSPLSLSFVSSADEMLPATTFSTVLRVAVITAGLGLAIVVVGAVLYQARRP